ncbi:hypothetical protein D3C81_1184930 [compost metagenome]
MLHCAATHPALAGAHAAATGEFGFAPVRVTGQCRVRHVFAAANQGVGLGQGLESRVEGERAVQRLGKTLPARPARPQLPGGLQIADRSVAGNRTFHQGQLTATEPCAFARRIMIGAVAGLPGIHRDGLIFDGATQCLTQLDVRNQPESTGQPITFQFDDVALLLQAHAFHSVGAKRRQYVGGGAVAVVEQAERLQPFAGPARQLRGETGDGAAAGLFGDALHLRAMLFGGGGTGQ